LLKTDINLAIIAPESTFMGDVIFYGPQQITNRRRR